jgi:hypothetical protein
MYLSIFLNSCKTYLLFAWKHKRTVLCNGLGFCSVAMDVNVMLSNLEESQNSVEAFQLFWVRRLKPFYNFVECLRFSVLKTLDLNVMHSNLEESQNSVEAFQLFWVRRLKSFYNFVECLRFSVLKTHSQWCSSFFRQFLIVFVRSVIDTSLVSSSPIPVAERSNT